MEALMTEAIEGLTRMMEQVSAEREVLAPPHVYADALSRMLAGKKVSASEIKAVTTVLVQAAEAMQPWSKRYTHQRMTYAVSMHNDATHALLALGVPLKATDGSVYAKDGSFGWPAYADEAGDRHRTDKP
jgi:hypothetical protein